MASHVGRLGFDLGDGGPTLLDLRFADDIMIAATAYIDAGVLLDELVARIEHRQKQSDDYRGSTAISSVNPSWFANRNS